MKQLVYKHYKNKSIQGPYVKLRWNVFLLCMQILIKPYKSNITGQIINLDNGRVLHTFHGNKCTYIPRGRNIGIKMGSETLNLYPKSQVVDIKTARSRPIRISSKTPRNFSLPNIPNPKSFHNVTSFRNDLSALRYLKNPFVATCVIVSFIGITVMCVICYLCLSKCCNRNGSSVNVFNGVDGGMLNRWFGG